MAINERETRLMEKGSKKYYLKTYGCQMNELDSSQMGRLLKKEGFLATQTPEEADLILINTCSIREKASQKLYSDIGRFRSLKLQRPDLLLGVAGCQAQAEGIQLKKRFAYLDFILGPDHHQKISEVIKKTSEQPSFAAQLGFAQPKDYQFVNLLPDEEENQVKAFVTIMKGCDNFCSFCIVPYVRGREVCRSAEDIVSEVKQLAELGVKEVTLLGQNVNSYGMGRHRLEEKTHSKKPGVISFTQLLKRISQETDIQRIRFTTSHPKDFPLELMEEFASNPKLAQHFHLPVQSGSNEVLKNMYRGYSYEEYLSLIENFRKLAPEASLSTDIIVGFPGETEADFQKTLQLLKEVQFDSIYSFHYSVRPKTTAANYFKDDVPLETKKERLLRLQTLQNEITLKRNQKYIGKELKVLVEGASKQSSVIKDNSFCGRSSQNHMLHFKGEESDIGQIISIKVTHAGPNSMLGEKYGN